LWCKYRSRVGSGSDVSEGELEIGISRLLKKEYKAPAIQIAKREDVHPVIIRVGGRVNEVP